MRTSTSTSPRGESSKTRQRSVPGSEQIEYRITDRSRFQEHLLRNGPQAVQEFANAVKLWEQRPAG